jgi:hypothetical protein
MKKPKQQVKFISFDVSETRDKSGFFVCDVFALDQFGRIWRLTDFNGGTKWVLTQFMDTRHFEWGPE